jgi:hypothetical protein
MRLRKSTSASSGTLIRKGRTASLSTAAAGCKESMLAAPAAAIPIAAVSKSRRRSWLIASVVTVVRMAESPGSTIDRVHTLRFDENIRGIFRVWSLARRLSAYCRNNDVQVGK